MEPATATVPESAPVPAPAPAYWDQVEGTGYVKAGFLGFPKSGKSYTAALLACGMKKKFGLKLPISFFDTENGAVYVAPLIQALTGELPLVKRARSFGDLLAWADQIEKIGAIGIVDSITHPWAELMDTWLERKNEALRKANKRPAKRLELSDIMAVKGEWNRRWTPFYVKSPLHLIVCGRAGWEWEHEVNEETGKKELHKTGVKMKTEADFGFEPSLLVEMERNQDLDGAHARIVRVANVIGERFGKIDGKQFEFPSLGDPEAEMAAVTEAFEPHLDMLRLGVHSDVSTAQTNLEMDENGEADWQREKRERTILAEEIQGEFESCLPGQSAAVKKERADLALELFGTRSWTAIENMRSAELRKGLGKLREIALARLQTRETTPMES